MKMKVIIIDIYSANIFIYFTYNKMTQIVMYITYRMGFTLLAYYNKKNMEIFMYILILRYSSKIYFGFKTYNCPRILIIFCMSFTLVFTQIVSTCVIRTKKRPRGEVIHIAWINHYTICKKRL